MMFLGALLLAMGMTLVDTSGTAGTGDMRPSVQRWTYSLRCYSCTVMNSFNCPDIATCDYEIRRCLTVSIRVSLRELLVHKSCTNNCTFMYQSLMPKPAPKALRTNSFYWVHCCNSMTCNYGGPGNLERDILPEEPVEEELDGAVRLRGSQPVLSLASVLLSRMLT